MPLSEYTDSIGGGLKLKGVKDGRVKKHKKKKSLKDGAVEAADEQAETTADKSLDDTDAQTPEAVEGKPFNRYGKTEAQLRHEERRRKMVGIEMEERMREEGVKSHKEKVEDLNKYLSKLSEHHDMPRIGPG